MITLHWYQDQFDFLDVYPKHKETNPHRMLALAVLEQAIDDARCEVNGRTPRYGCNMLMPHPSRWIDSLWCQDVCEMAGISWTEFRQRLLTVMEVERREMRKKKHVPSVSERRQQALDLMKAGLSQREAAKRARISTNTLYKYRNAVA